MLSKLHAAHRGDPSRTSDIRSRYEDDFMRRINKILEILETSILENQALPIQNVGAITKYKGDSPAEIADSVTAHIGDLHDEFILAIRKDPVTGRLISRDEWQREYVEQAYLRSVVQAETYLSAQGMDVSKRTLRKILADKFHADAITELYEVNYKAMKTVQQATERNLGRKIRRILIRGYAEGESRAKISKTMYDSIVDSVDGIERARTRMIARTEIINAHAEASLNTFEANHVAKTTAMVEFSTAGDDRVCSKCKSLNGKLFSIKNARGVIAVHPSCRCAWLPVVNTIVANRILKAHYGGVNNVLTKAYGVV